MSEKIPQQDSPDSLKEQEALKKIWQIVNELQEVTRNPQSKKNMVEWTKKYTSLQQYARMLLDVGEIDQQTYAEITKIGK